MKTIAIVYEGAAEIGLSELDGRTPLQVTRMHNASRLAAAGSCGGVNAESGPVPWRSERVLAQLCGVDPKTASRWKRGPIEAAAQVDWPDVDWIYRADLVATDGDVLRPGGTSRLTEEETAALVNALAEGLAKEPVELAMSGPGTVAVGLRGTGGEAPEGESPFGLEGQPVALHRPAGKAGLPARRLMERAAEILARHPVNDVRVDLGEDPANTLWLWGGGPRIPPGAVTTPLTGCGSMLTGSRLGQGLAVLCGLDPLPVTSMWKEVLWNEKLPLRELVEVLRERDRLVVYVEAPQGGGVYGSGVDKTRALDHLDQSLLGPLRELLEAYRPFRVLLMTCSAVSTETRQPLAAPVPVVVSGAGITADEVTRWDEDACVNGALGRMNLEDFFENLSKQDIWP